MPASNGSDNVIAFAPYRAARLAQRPALPYVLWYPGIGFIKAGVPALDAPASLKRTLRSPDCA